MDPKRRKIGDHDVSDLRLQSRQKYLAEREQTQLALLRRQVAEEAEEEERLGSKLSERERKDFARNRETLRLAESRNAIDEHLDGFIIPDADFSNKAQVLTQRHSEKGYEKSEVQLWEEEQTRKVATQVKRPVRASADDYELVFDEQQNIKFVGDLNFNPDTFRLEQQLNEAERRAQTIEETRKALPVYKFKEEFIAAVKEYPVVIFVGQTGSGKTTQLTQYLYEAGFGKNGRIGCTQPRRVAAMSVAKRVAEEAGVRLGKEVGYNVRFDAKMDEEKTKILYLTDGLLLRSILTNPTLEEYSVIIIDEAHERTIASDILLVLAREISRTRRSDFRLVISSATLDAEFFSRYMDDAPIMNCPGRTFPVERLHSSSPEANYLSAAVTTVFQIHLSQGPGDILVFFTGEDEILQAADYIESTAKKLGSKAAPLVVAPVYGALPSEAQQLIFQPCPPGSRKVVLATNIAETSLTIDGIVYVIDSGLCKQKVYNPKLGQEALVVVPCSRASAEQRAGRAGRTQSGKTFRLYTKYAFYNELPAVTEPEILRSCLDGPILTLKALGINDILNFELPSKPSSDQIIAALENLYALGFLTSLGEVSKMGRRASEIPLDPKLAKALLAADEFGCVEEMVSLAAMVSEAGTLFFAPKDKKAAADLARLRFASEYGDMISLLKLWSEFVETNYSIQWCRENFVQYRSLNRVRDVRDQLLQLCDRVEIARSSSGIDAHDKIMKSFVSGYFANTARLNRDGQSYRSLATGTEVHIHPSSCLREKRPRLVVFYEQVTTTKDWIRSCAPIEPEWLSEVAPHYFKKKQIDDLNVGKKMGKGPGKVGTGR